MVNIIEINNPLQNVVSDSFINEVIDGGIHELKKESIVAENLQFEISVALIDKDEIARYNLEYRKADRPTDVLSFCYESSKTVIVGEMLLCWKVIREYAREDKLEPLDEFRKNLVHSLLHIIGFEHGDEMFSLQKKILETKMKKDEYKKTIS